MIINEFVKYGVNLESIKKSIEEIDYSDKYFWGNFRWGFYDNKIFILFEYNEFYGHIIRQIAYNENGVIIQKDCSDGGIDEKVCSILNIEIEYDWYLRKYHIEQFFDSSIDD